MLIWGRMGELRSPEWANRNKENIQLFGRPSLLLSTSPGLPLPPLSVSSLLVRPCRRHVSPNHVVNNYKATRSNVPENGIFDVYVISNINEKETIMRQINLVDFFISKLIFLKI